MPGIFHGPGKNPPAPSPTYVTLQPFGIFKFLTFSMKSLVLILRTADNYTQTENMDNIHPGSNESAKQPDEILSDLEQYFDNVTVDEAAHKAPDGISIL